MSTAHVSFLDELNRESAEACRQAEEGQESGLYHLQKHLKRAAREGYKCLCVQSRVNEHYIAQMRAQGLHVVVKTHSCIEIERGAPETSVTFSGWRAPQYGVVLFIPTL